MTPNSDNAERRDLIRRLFVLATSIAEDAAALAAEGQGDEQHQESTSTAVSRLETMGADLATVAAAVRLLTGESS